MATKTRRKGLGFLPLGAPPHELPIQIEWAPRGHANVKPAKCPDHPRAGRDADLTMKRLTISCFRCNRVLLVVPGPFRTTGSM